MIFCLNKEPLSQQTNNKHSLCQTVLAYGYIKLGPGKMEHKCRKYGPKVITQSGLRCTYV